MLILKYVDSQLTAALKVRLSLFLIFMEKVQMQSNRSKLFIFAQVSLLFAGAKFGP